MSQPAPRPPQAYLLSQGDEVITGQTLDRNASWLSEQLTDLGVQVRRRVTVGDDLEDITAAVDEALTHADLVICTGGLGPTSDDLTAEAVSQATGRPLVLHAPSLERIATFFAAIGRTMSPANEKQALLPEGCVVLDNDWGTAPGFAVRRDRPQGPCWAYFLPGVPREMKPMFAERVLPGVQQNYTLQPGRLVTLRVMGVPESRLEQDMRPFMGIPGLAVGFRAMTPEVQVKLRAAAGFDEARLAAVVAQAQEAIGRGVFGVDTGPLAEVVGLALQARGQTLACAESCTGGRIAAEVTSVPGASAWFMEGACTYANEAKVRTCGVDPALLAAHGAVSEPVARAMAEGIRARAGTTYGLSSTGVAGPGGGSPEKPVGTVHIALATPEGTHHRLLRLGGDRERIMALTVGAALDLLRRHLGGLLEPAP